jgi:hypothetical protein
MSKSLSAALPLLLLILAATDVEASVSQTRGTVSSHSQVQRSKIGRLPFVVARGGATVTDEEDEVNLDEEDDDEEDDEDEKEDEELDPVMVKAAIKSSYKSKQKKTAAVKAKVSEKLASQKAPTKSTTPSKKKKSGSLWNKVPYIIRVCLNPFTVIAMTRAYFASLFNLNYLQVVRFTSM